MVRPDPFDDAKLLAKESWEEITKALRFYRAQANDAAGDRKKKYREKLLEFGPINYIKLVVVIILTIIAAIAFSLFSAEHGVWIVLIIFLIIADLVFEWWGYARPAAVKTYEGVQWVIKGIYDELVTLIRAIITDIKELVIDLVKGK